MWRGKLSYSFDETKLWLNRAYKIDELAQLDKKKIQEWEELATTIGGFSTDEKVQKSTNTETAFISKLFKKDEAIKKYNDRIIARYQAKEEIDEVINSLKNHDMIQVLDYRFLQFQSFQKIADIMYMSKSVVYRLYEKGVIEVAKILEQKER